jgi:hypothetical protein
MVSTIFVSIMTRPPAGIVVLMSARLLVIGTRPPGEGCFYPDEDLMRVETGTGCHMAHKDGRRC